MIKKTMGTPRTGMSLSALDRSDKKKYDYSKPVENPIFDVHIPHELVTFDDRCVNTHFYATMSKHSYWNKYRVNLPRRTYKTFTNWEHLPKLADRFKPKCTSSTVHLYDYSHFCQDSRPVHLSRYDDKTSLSDTTSYPSLWANYDD